MASKQINYESEYKSIRSQYDALLDKNQNDLIKIKQKQRQLTEEVEKYKKEKECAEQQHNKTIKELQAQLQNERKKQQVKGELTVNVHDTDKDNERVKELQMDARKLMDQNIGLTSENTSLHADARQLRQKNEGLCFQIERMKQFINSIQKELNDLKSKKTDKTTTNSSTQSEKKVASEDDMNALKEQTNRLQKELQSMALHNTDLKHKLKTSEEQTRLLSDRQKRSVHLLKRKDFQLTQMQEQVQKLRLSTKLRKRKTQSDDTPCNKCKEYQQQIQLLKQMVKSTKGMVRVREIQAEKYRMHSHEELVVKENRSYGKGVVEKAPTLPPLKKKNGE